MFWLLYIDCLLWAVVWDTDNTLYTGLYFVMLHIHGKIIQCRRIQWSIVLLFKEDCTRKCCKNQHKGTRNFRQEDFTKKVGFELNIVKGLECHWARLEQVFDSIKHCEQSYSQKQEVVQRVGSKRGWPQYKVQIRTWKAGSPHRWVGAGLESVLQGWSAWLDCILPASWNPWPWTQGTT